MLYRELLTILEDMSENDLDQVVTIESEVIGESTDVEFDGKSNTIVAYEQ